MSRAHVPRPRASPSLLPARGARVLDTCPERRAHVLVEDVMTVVSGRGAHVPMQGQVTLQVMRLLQEVVQVKALLV